MKLTKSQLDQIINEEVNRFLKIKALKKQLNEVTEELKHMEEEDLDEVKAGSETHVKSHAWTGEEDGDVKWKPEFQKKGSHLLEDEDMEMSGEFEKMFAEIGKMIDAKLGDEDMDDDFEEVEMDMETPEGEEDVDDSAEITDEELEEIHAKMKMEEEMEHEDKEKEEGYMKEGEYMEEKEQEETTKEYAETIGSEEEQVHSDAMKMKENINESVTTRRYKLLSENLESEDKLAAELQRMRALAKLD